MHMPWKVPLVLAFCSMPQILLAAGFQVHEQNAAHLGLAYSGTAALAEDASTNFYNAAGLMHLKEKQLVLSNVLVKTEASVVPQSATTTYGRVVTNTTPDNAGSLTTMPSFHYGARITDDWVFGLSIASPFGLKTRYSATSPVRYVANKSKLQTIDIGPSLAYQVDPHWSVAAGPNMQKGILRLSTTIGSNNDLNQDGIAKNYLEGWARGFHAGVLYKPHSQGRLGLHYRSKMKYKGTGTYILDTPEVKGATRVSAEIVLPESMVLSGYYEFAPCWSFLFDAEWTHWDRFEELFFRYANTNLVGTQQGSTTVHYGFKNTWRFAGGLNYQQNDAWSYRIGVAWDETPTQTVTRTARVPDENRVWAALGAQYRYDKRLSLDLGYAHLFFHKVWVDDSAPLTASYVGSYRPYANLFGLQINWSFD